MERLELLRSRAEVAQERLTELEIARCNRRIAELAHRLRELER